MSQRPKKKTTAAKRKPTQAQPQAQAQAQTTKSSTPPAASSSAKQANARAAKKAQAQAEAKKKRQMQMIVGGVVVAVAIALVAVLLNRPTASGVQIDYSGIDSEASGIIAAAGTPVSPPDGAGPVDVATGFSLGSADAPVTMHIFSDFQCHFCLQFHEETLPSVIDDFVRTGQVRLVFHDFPRLGTDSSIANPDDLSVELRDPNNESSLAAQAAMCAGEQDQYLEMSDKLFANFGGVQAGAFKMSNLRAFAEDLDLNMDEFNACVASGKYIPALATSVKQGQDNGITATPMFILDNGSGDLNVIQQTAEGYSLMKKQIEASISTAP